MKRSNKTYKFATQNSVNRRNVSQKTFEASIAYDEVCNDHKENRELLMYTVDGAYVAWYDARINSGYVSVGGLK